MGATKDGGNRKMEVRETVTGAAERFLEEKKAAPTWSIFRMPAFWVVLLLAAVAILVVTLTSCGRKIDTPEPSVSASVTASATESGSAQPTTSAEPSVTPEESGPDLPPQVEGAWPVPWGVMTAKGLRYGYADESGNLLIEPVYADVAPFSGFGLAIVTDEAGHSGVIDREGRLVVPMKPAYISQLDNGLISVGLSTGDGGVTATEVYGVDGKLRFTVPDYLSTYHEGFSSTWREGAGGYLDETGKLAIPFDGYLHNDFCGGYAVVGPKADEPSHLIDTKGNDVTATVSNGITMYLDETTKLFGYRKADGSKLTEAVYREAEPFRHGVAIVRYSPDPASYGGGIGLLGEDGKWRIEPLTGGIRRLSNGLLLVGAPLKQAEYLPWDYLDYCDTALHDAQGNRLTDYDLRFVQDAGEGLVSVCDGTRIGFVGADGEAANEWPTIEGVGSLRIENGLIVGTVNGFHCVYDKAGRRIAIDRLGFDLGDGIRLTGERAEGSILTDLLYPVVDGLQDAAAQKRINEAIRARLGTVGVSEPEVDEATGMVNVETVEGGWAAWRVGDVLVVEQSSYWYALGAAHGMPGIETMHFDMATGQELSLTDLFGQDGANKAFSLMAERINENITLEMEEVGYFVESIEVTADRPFRLTQEGVMLIWPPYEIASYAAGFREFTIPWDALADVLDLQNPAIKALGVR